MEIPVGKSNPWMDSLVAGLILVVIGVLLAVLQEGALNIILMIAGIMILLYGAFAAYGGFKAGVPVAIGIGVLVALFGVLLLVLPNLFSDILMILLAIALIVSGVMSLSTLAPSYVESKQTKVLSGVSGAVMLILGIVVLFNLDGAADIVMILIGVFTVISGLMKLYEAYLLKQWA